MIAGISQLGASIGRGLIAGVLGTAMMTASSTAEMRLRKRQASSAPADAAGKLIGVEPRDAGGEKRFSTLVHLGYGTGWGAVRGVLSAAGLKGTPATASHFLLVWVTEMVMLPRLKVSPPATEWGVKEVAIDGWHHLVYASATGAAFDLLEDHA
jgi:hypothetical protein